MARSGLLGVESEADAMDSFEVHLWVGFKIFPQFGNEYVHAPAEEIVVFAPDVEQDLFSFKDAVGVFAKKFQQIGFFLGQIEDFGADGELQIGVGEIELADGKGDGLFRMHLPGPAQEHFHAHQELLDAEGFGDIVVGSALESFELVFFHGFGRQEKDGHHIALLPDLFGDSEPVFVRHHDIEQTDREFVFVEFVDGSLTVGAQDYVITGINQIILDDISEGKIVFSQ